MRMWVGTGAKGGSSAAVGATMVPNKFRDKCDCRDSDKSF